MHACVRVCVCVWMDELCTYTVYFLLIVILSLRVHLYLFTHKPEYISCKVTSHGQNNGPICRQQQFQQSPLRLDGCDVNPTSYSEGVKGRLGTNCKIRNFVNYSSHQALFELPKQTSLDGRGTWRVRERREMHTGVSGGCLKKSYHWEDLSVNGRILLKCICKGWDGSAWTRLIWLKVRASGKLL